jgi:hypothetical protein
MALRIFLGFSMLVWLPYGLFCFAVPSFLHGAAGVLAQTPTGVTELRAMYGGLQTGIGLLCLGALMRRSLVRPALVMLAFLASGLFLARVTGAVVLDGGLSGYTVGGLLFEFVSSCGALALLARGPVPDVVGR